MPDNDDSDVELSRPEFARMVKRAPAVELERLMSGPRRRAILDDLVAGMPDVFRKDRAGALDTVVHWVVGDRPSGGADVYEIVISAGTCVVSGTPAREPRLSLSLGAVDFVRMVTGNANPVALLLKGKLRTAGDLGLAGKFPRLFDIPRA